MMCYTTWMLWVVGRRIGDLGPGHWGSPGLVLGMVMSLPLHEKENIKEIVKFVKIKVIEQIREFKYVESMGSRWLNFYPLAYWQRSILLVFLYFSYGVYSINLY